MTNRTTVGLLAGLAAPGLIVALCACGSSAHSAGSAGSAATVQSTCQQVSAVLSDGPDPDADPVGYAEAQILPLRQISTPDQALHDAIGQLARAYQEFYASNGTSSKAKEAVAAASKKINSICPGAAS
jgi:hypothetical protein